MVSPVSSPRGAENQGCTGSKNRGRPRRERPGWIRTRFRPSGTCRVVIAVEVLAVGVAVAVVVDAVGTVLGAGRVIGAVEVLAVGVAVAVVVDAVIADRLTRTGGVIVAVPVIAVNE